MDLGGFIPMLQAQPQIYVPPQKDNIIEDIYEYL